MKKPRWYRRYRRWVYDRNQRRAMNKCCRKLENRKPGPGPRGLPGPKPDDVSVTHCRVCDCRHFEAAPDPLKLGLTGSSLS